MSTPETVLVTGSSGTIGTALSERLIEEGVDVVGADISANRWSSRVDSRTVHVDLRNRAALDDLPADVDAVVHLAANARVRALVDAPEKARDNFEMTFNVLEHARQNDIPRVLFSSSREIYGAGGETVRREHDTSISDSESPYTASKVGGEAMVEAYARCYDLDACVLRFSNVYGRYDASDRLIPRFITRAVQGRDLPVYGRNKVLDFTYIDDCVDGIVRAIDRFELAAGMQFNVASGEGRSLLQVANAITDRVSSPSTVRVEESKVGEVHRFVADISNARKILGYEPTHSPLGGLDRTIDWYAERDLSDEIDAAPGPSEPGAVERGMLD